MGTDLDQVARIAISKATRHNLDQSTNPAKAEARAQLASLAMQPINDTLASSSSSAAMQKRIQELESAQSAPTTNLTGKRQAADIMDLSQEHTNMIFLNNEVEELNNEVEELKVTNWLKSLPLDKDQSKHLQESINVFNKLGGLDKKDQKDARRILASMGIPFLLPPRSTGRTWVASRWLGSS